MALRGTMIMESLLSGVVLEGVELHVTRIARGDVGDVDAGQPLAWTVIDFEAAEADAREIDALVPRLASGRHLVLRPS